MEFMSSRLVTTYIHNNSNFFKTNFVIFRHPKISKIGMNKIKRVTSRKIRSSASSNTTLRIIAY